MEKLTNKNHTEAPQSKKTLWLMIMFIGIMTLLCVNLISGLEFDNIKGDLIIDETTSKYGKVDIKDWFGTIDLATIELKENTDVCGASCSSETEIIMYQAGALIDDVRFIGYQVKDYQFYIQTGFSETGKIIDIWEKVCSPYSNKTGEGETCEWEITGAYPETNPKWTKYNIGDEVTAGTYYIKLEGSKDFYSTTDWIIKTQGKEITEWADWGAGGTITYYGDYVIHTFLASGYFNVTRENDIEILVVAGGGAGGGLNYGGGGGAGGLVYNATYTLVAGNYSVVVGAGGASDNDGGNSTFGNIIAIGGGQGGHNVGGDAPHNGIAGGSGGGGGAHTVSLGAGAGTQGFHNDSGLGYGKDGGVSNDVTYDGGGGGGGAGEHGHDALEGTWNGGGGDGLAYNFNGTSIYYAGGGGGGRNVASDSGGPGGLGGGGRGSDGQNHDNPVAGTANTGGGGGGQSDGGVGAAGGSGIVIIRYENPSNYSEVTTTLNSPADYLNTTSTSITFNCSAVTTTPSGEVLTNITLYIDGVLNETKVVTGITNLSIFTKNIPEGTYEWTCNSFNNASFNDWGTNRTLTIDSTYPLITINQPTGSKDYGYTGKAETLNWTVVDTNFASVWYNYNGTNFTLTGAINTTTFYLKSSPFNITVWANDSIGNTNKTTKIWDYRLFENEQSYTASTYEGKTNPFTYNLTYVATDWNVITGTLVYNNTNYSGTKTGSGNNLLFTSNTYAPSVAAETNVSFYWRIGLTNSSGTTNIEAATYNQTVKIINMSLCGSPHTVPFINFTCYDESTYAPINCTTSLTFDYKISEANFFQTFNYENDSSVDGTIDFCFSPPSEDYTLNSVMEYSATGYAQRYYNFEGIEFTNTTTEIGLYLLNTTDSTSFIVVVQDANYQPLTGVEVYMQKYNAGTGTWVTVEIATTNDDGKTISHIYTEDSIYRFKIYDDGTLVHTSTGSVIACPEVPCTVTITLSESLTNPLEIFLDLDDLETSLVYSKTTEMITYTYSDTSGVFSKARLYVIRSHPGIPDITYTCNETGLSTAAVLTCDLTNEQNGTYIASGFITRIDEVERMVQRKAFLKIKDIVGVIGLEGVLWSMFLFIGILMLGVYRPSLGIIFGIVGIILISLLQLMVFSITAIVAVIGIGAILLLEVRKQ